MKWYDILFKYWAQILLFLGIIGYFIRIFLEHRFKRREISYGVFAKAKLDALSKFLETYELAQSEAHTHLIKYFSNPDHTHDYLFHNKTLSNLSNQLEKQRQHL